MKKVEAFGMMIDHVTLDEALSELIAFAKKKKKGYVVTPNTDHVIKFHKNPEFRKAYGGAAFTFADGAPVVAVSKLAGNPLPERVTGVDIFLRILPMLEENKLSLFLLGPSEEVNKAGADKIALRHPKMKIKGRYAPLFGFEKNPAELDKMFKIVKKAKPDFLFIFLSCPKQELWISQNIQKLDLKVAICLGASLEFYTSHRKRAPRIFQLVGMEWVWRMFSEPKRLIKRYLVDDMFPFLWLAFKEIVSKRFGRKKQAAAQ